MRRSDVVPDIYSRFARWSVLHVNPGFVPIIVYQMAKVGSSAVAGALALTGRPVFHVHRMNADHLEAMRAGRRARGWRSLPVPAHDRLGLRLNEKVVKAGRAAKIVTLVREPIGRNLSSYFEHLDAIWHAADAHTALSMAELRRGFIERYPHDEPLTWFDDEMRPVLGIDVYDRPFDTRGCMTMRHANVDVLVLKSEMDDDAKRRALAAFLDLDVPPLAPVNRTADKAKGAAYAQFVETVGLTDAYLDRMLSSRYCRHFYREDERESLRRKYLA